MIEQDYAELLSRTPPSGDTLEWTFSTRLFAIAFPSFLVGTPALCLILFVSGVSGEDHDPRHGGTNFRVRDNELIVIMLVLFSLLCVIVEAMRFIPSSHSYTECVV